MIKNISICSYVPETFKNTIKTSKSMFENRAIVGLTEKIGLRGNNHKEIELVARIDTGATKSSMDTGLAKELELGPIVKSKIVKSVHGRTTRPVVWVNLSIAGKSLRALFTLADRKHMKYRALIGQNVLKKYFVVDPLKK